MHLRVMRGVQGPALGGALSTLFCATTIQLFRPGDCGAKDTNSDKVDALETPARRRAHVRVNVGAYAGLLQRACPAGVYEYVADDGGHVVPGNAGVRPIL